MKKRVVIGFLGTTMDTGKGETRWERWRPTVALCQHGDLVVDRLELLRPEHRAVLAKRVARDIIAISPATEVRHHVINLDNPWDFEEVYGALHDFARAYPFDQDVEDYLIHITTGTHVAQICMFLLTETRSFPARLLQLNPPKRWRHSAPGSYTIIDLDLSRYDRIAQRFRVERDQATSFLKSGIPTRNAAFNRMIERIEKVAIGSSAPLLLTGPTGAGKSQLARRIYELKQSRHQVRGPFVEVNCATLRGESAMSTLFGHVKGAFTGAVTARNGLLRAADTGVLFLDEIGELGIDEQAMILRAIEDKVFLPVGADREVSSDFQLIAGTNRDLATAVSSGRFRDDLLARLNLWTFRLPGLKDRRQDIEPNLAFELSRHAEVGGTRVTFNTAAKRRYLAFAMAPEALWTANFRDLSASVTRMATLSPEGRITEAIVAEEIDRLTATWRDSRRDSHSNSAEGVLHSLFAPARIQDIDRFDRVQLAEVVRVCRNSTSLSAAGRTLFAASRSQRRSTNDADRLRKYLARFGLDWHSVTAASQC